MQIKHNDHFLTLSLSTSMISGVLIIVPYRVLPVQNAGHRGSVLYAQALSKYARTFLASTKDMLQNHPYSFNALPFFSVNRWVRYSNIFYFFKLHSFIKKNKISHLVFEQPYLIFLFLMFRFFTKIPCIYHSHNIEYERFKSYKKPVWRILYIFEKIFYTYAHQIHTVSPDDMSFAIEKFEIINNNIYYVPAAILLNESPKDNEACKNTIRQKHNVSPTTTLLFFSGALGYEPNQFALDNIVHQIIPMLKAQNFEFKIIICGGGLPNRYEEFKHIKEIIYTGFVEDISVYNKGVDMMINPVIEGGGVKVKLLDALTYNLTCVSTSSGAKGVNYEICGNNLHITADHDWQAFIQKIILLSQQNTKSNIPPSFYEHYSIDAIGRKAYQLLNKN